MGVVMAARSSGQGITVRGVQDYIEGFGITAQENTSAASMATESSPPPATTAKPEPRPVTHDREITGKDGAPVVLIPAGEFWMGSPDGEGETDEHPRHKMALSTFYLDKHEVTNRRFNSSSSKPATGPRQSGRARPGHSQLQARVRKSLGLIGENRKVARRCLIPIETNILSYPFRGRTLKSIVVGRENGFPRRQSLNTPRGRAQRRSTGGEMATLVPGE